MRSARTLGNMPASLPLAADDITELHAARLLLLLHHCRAMAQVLPDMAMAKEFRPYRLSPAELISPEVREALSMQGMSIERFLDRDNPDMLELMKHLPSREITLGESRLGYGLVAVGGYQEPLRELHGQNCSIDGMTPIEIYEHDVLARIAIATGDRDDGDSEPQIIVATYEKAIALILPSSTGR